VCSKGSPQDEVVLLSRAEAIVEVRRWLGVEGADPEQVFIATGESTIRYRDLIPILEQETPDADLLCLAISRGKGMKVTGPTGPGALLDILPAPPTSGAPPASRE
jgi:hypothetical protein